MAAKRKTADGATGTVQARRKTEALRQAEARAVRAEIVAETTAAQRKLAKFHANKPTDSRNLDR